MDRSRRCWWWRGSLTTAPLCRGGPSLLPVKPCPSNSRKPAQADLWDHPPPPPPPFLLPYSDRRGPPLVLSVSLFVPCDLVQPCGRAAAERNAQNTQDRRVRKYESDTQLGSWCFSAICTQRFEKLSLKGSFSPEYHKTTFSLISQTIQPRREVWFYLFSDICVSDFCHHTNTKYNGCEWNFISGSQSFEKFRKSVSSLW